MDCIHYYLRYRHLHHSYVHCSYLHHNYRSRLDFVSAVSPLTIALSCDAEVPFHRFLNLYEVRRHNGVLEQKAFLGA
jgi:hypothetical protein